MKTGKRIWVGAILAGIFVLGLGALDGQKAVEQTEKTIPIKFKLLPGSVLEQKIAAKIEEDNVELAKLLVQLRKTSKESLRGIDLVPFQRTYLRNPRFLTEDGGVFVGWPDILPRLKEIVDKSTYLDIQAVRVKLAYVPYGGATAPKADVDFKAVIRVQLVSVPDDPPQLEGYLLHRRTCEIEPGDSL